MIINSGSPEGAKAKIFDKEGNQVTLPIKAYNTETQEAEVYELDENGKVKTSEWVKEGHAHRRYVLTSIVKLEGSYAEIDGKRV